MANKKKKIIIAAAALGTIGVLCVGAFYAYRLYDTKFSLRAKTESVYGITLPKGAKRIYSVNNVGWFGEGVAYSVWKLKDDSPELVRNWKKESDLIFQGNLERVLKSHEGERIVTDEYIPDWESGYIWKQTHKKPTDANPKSRDAYGKGYSDHFYMIYFPDSLRLILCSERM